MNSNSSSTKKKQSKHSKNESSYDNANGGLDTINEMSDQLTTIANVSAIAARFLVTLLCLSLNYPLERLCGFWFQGNHNWGESPQCYPE
jgi:hypothetical protein